MNRLNEEKERQRRVKRCRKQPRTLYRRKKESPIVDSHSPKPIRTQPNVVAASCREGILAIWSMSDVRMEALKSWVNLLPVGWVWQGDDNGGNAASDGNWSIVIGSSG